MKKKEIFGLFSKFISNTYRLVSSKNTEQLTKTKQSLYKNWIKLMMFYCSNRYCEHIRLQPLLKRNHSIITTTIRLNSQLQENYTNVIAEPILTKSDLQPLMKDLLAVNKIEESKKSLNQLPNFIKKLQAVVNKNQDKKHLLLGDPAKVKLSKTYISNKLAKSLLKNKELFVKDEIEIASFLEYLTYKNLKSIEKYFLDKYKSSNKPVPLCIYNVFFRNYRQLLQNQKIKLAPNELINDIKGLFLYKSWELKHKYGGNLPVLNESDQLIVEEIFSDFLQQIILSLKYKNIKSSFTNKKMLGLISTVDYGSDLTLKNINLIIQSFKGSFGIVENRICQTQMIQILGNFNNFDKQMELFQHMKFLSLKKNAPDKAAYLNMLISKLKQKDLLGGLDLIDEYRENMKVYYEKIYLNKLSLNQRDKQQVPLLPIHFNDPDFFENLHQLYQKMESQHQLDLEQCNDYYIGVPIELRIMFIRLIISVCSGFKVDKESGLTPESIIGYRCKAWDLLYGILLELPGGGQATSISNSSNNMNLISGLISSKEDNVLSTETEVELKVKAKQLIQNICEINFNDSTVIKALNSVNIDNSSLNDRSSQLKKDFIKVCMELSLFEKDVELSRCVYLKFFNEFISPKLDEVKNSQLGNNVSNKMLKKDQLLDFTKILSFREREFWMQIYHTLLKTYYNNDLSNLSTNATQSSVKKIMNLVNENKRGNMKFDSQQKLNALKIYEINPKTHWIRSKIMENIGISNGEFKQLDIPFNFRIKIPFLPTLTINEDSDLKLMEIKAVHEWHYYNLWNNLDNIHISKSLEGEKSVVSPIKVPSLFKSELDAIIESGDTKFLKYNIKGFLMKWFAYNCQKNFINPLLTQEGVMLSYISSPMKYGSNHEEFINRLDKHCIDILKLDELVETLKTNKDNDVVEKLYFECFKIWKDESILLAQLEYSDVNNDVKFMKRTWNERLINKKFSIDRNSNMKSAVPLVLSKEDKIFYRKYVKTQFENDLILESFEFVKATSKYINYEYNDLKNMIDVLKELEDFNKVDYLKQIINESKMKSYLKNV